MKFREPGVELNIMIEWLKLLVFGRTWLQISTGRPAILTGTFSSSPSSPQQNAEIVS
jgi:hypothetical protein